MALPLGIVATFGNLNLNIPKYYVDYYCGDYQLGIFSSISFIVVVVGAYVMEPVFSTSCHRLAMYYRCDRTAFKRLLGKIVLISVANALSTSVVAAIWGRQILSMLYRPEYGEHPVVLALLMATAGMDSMAFALFSGLTAARRFYTQMPISLVQLATTTFACTWLVPRYGLLGGAWALALGALFRLLAYAVFLAQVLLSPELEPVALTPTTAAVEPSEC